MEQIIYYYDNPADPFPAVLTIFPEVVKLTWALLDTLNGTSCLGEVNEAMLRLQGTMDKALRAVPGRCPQVCSGVPA